MSIGRHDLEHHMRNLKEYNKNIINTDEVFHE